MPELEDQMYCSQQIVIPPRYPYILKRYCKAAIKTQPYDLLRWSFEYFRALSENRAPPVKLRLEYPVFCTEGGLTRGCLKVLANQLIGLNDVPLSVIKRAWAGFCLDNKELIRILCLCEVYTREESVSYLHFIAVAGGMLTKCLTHTMILLCETLTKEPDGGSASIPSHDFMTMYQTLARMDCSKDCLYVKGYREGTSVEAMEKELEAEQESDDDYANKPDSTETEENKSVASRPNAFVPPSKPGDHDHVTGDEPDDFWGDGNVQKLNLIDDQVARSNRLSIKLNMPIHEHFERSPSVERASKIERENFMMDNKGSLPQSNAEIDNMLRNMSLLKTGGKEKSPSPTGSGSTHATMGGVCEVGEINMDVRPPEKVADEEMPPPEDKREEGSGYDEGEGEEEMDEDEKIRVLLKHASLEKQKRIDDMLNTFEEINEIVAKYKSANYDLGMVAGRQMSTTSGEFIVQHIEQELMDYINEQIAILPDPDLKKKKARPEEIAMVQDMITQFIDDRINEIVVEIEEIEEEEEPIPEIVQVYAVPGIGPIVDEETIEMFEDFISDICKTQGDMVMPRNIRHFLCPPLEKYEELMFDSVPTQADKVND